MSHKQLLITLPALSLIVSGFSSSFAQESGGGVGWIGVLIVLVLLIPLAWWLRQSSGAAALADHGHHSPEPHPPIQSSYPLETEAINPVPINPAPIEVEDVAEGAAEVVQNVVDEIAETAAEGEEEIEAIAAPPAPEKVESGFAAAAAESQPATRRAQAPAKADDLVIIEGIGPKIAAILQENGIQTFADLSAADPNQIVAILQKAGLSNIANPATWAEQAQLAAAGRWDELKTLQGQLKGGRRS